MRETRLAVRDYTEALRLEPDNVQALTDRVEAYQKVRRIDLAIDDYTEAIRRDPASSDHIVGRSVTPVWSTAWREFPITNPAGQKSPRGLDVRQIYARLSSTRSRPKWRNP
jgi:tetratricopeptide (TPR) repeat protein